MTQSLAVRQDGLAVYRQWGLRCLSADEFRSWYRKALDTGNVVTMADFCDDAIEPGETCSAWCLLQQAHGRCVRRGGPPTRGEKAR